MMLADKRINAIFFDFDGVFTDNTVIVDEYGRESVVCSRSDGMGIEMLRKMGIPMLVLTKEQNPVAGKRCAKMKIPCFRGINNKISVLTNWLHDHDIVSENAIYVGNDINDIGCMEMVGLSVCPADAHPSVLEKAKIVLKNKGGRGAVRELADMIVNQCGR